MQGAITVSSLPPPIGNASPMSSALLATKWPKNAPDFNDTIPYAFATVFVQTEKAGVDVPLHSHPNGQTWKRTEEGAWKQDVFAYYVSDACNHCADPACVKVCPTKAHVKHLDKGGLVLIDESKCIGCGACATACPYHAPQLDAKAQKMRKCDGCIDRLEKGLLPICVEACPHRAIEFGDIEELRRKHGTNAEIAPLPSASLTKPNLVVGLPRRNSKPAGDKSGSTY